MLSTLNTTMNDASESLQKDNGHVYYVGGSDSAGITGFIDASEVQYIYS